MDKDELIQQAIELIAEVNDDRDPNLLDAVVHLKGYLSISEAKRKVTAENDQLNIDTGVEGDDMA